MSGSDPTGFSWLSDILNGNSSSGWEGSTFFGAALGVVGGAYIGSLAQAGAFAEGGSLSGLAGASGLGGAYAIGEAFAGLNDPGANATYAAPTGELGSGAWSQGGLQAKTGDPFDPSELRPSNQALTSTGFGFEDTGAVQGLPVAWRQLLQPLFTPYGVNLGDVRVVLRNLGGDAGQYLGGNTIALDRGRIFDSSRSGNEVAGWIAHEVAHVWQARLLGGWSKLRDLISIETEARAASGFAKYGYPAGFNLPAPNRLPGAASLEGIADRFGDQGKRLHGAVVW